MPKTVKSSIQYTRKVKPLNLTGKEFKHVDVCNECLDFFLNHTIAGLGYELDPNNYHSSCYVCHRTTESKLQWQRKQKKLR